jgi:hypothetical protein
MDKVKVFWIEKIDLVEVRFSGTVVGHYTEAEAENVRISLRDKVIADTTRESYISSAPLYRGPDGSIYEWRDAPPGAMTNATWLNEFPDYTGHDGISLIVKLPNKRDWLVDSRASNCTMKEDHVHKCWVRHGDPRTGHVHVDKKGPTCGAGAGSILAGDYHGFLHDGYLVRC